MTKRKTTCLSISKATVRQINLIKSELSLQYKRKFTTNQTIKTLIKDWKEKQQQQ